MNLENQNVPQSYRDFMANTPQNQMTSVRYGRRKTAKQNSTLVRITPFMPVICSLAKTTPKTQKA
ncbi:hypothetical protein [Capnocytophaga stomatis]|uniref:hypothetical protein n=1 Tax=Capnocytophaga stomatis TaxID=1848904 RepID=UPI0012FFAF5D|nr:hypothetical protein [Capnocytophaga stomatis]